MGLGKGYWICGCRNVRVGVCRGVRMRDKGVKACRRTEFMGWEGSIGVRGREFM